MRTKPSKFLESHRVLKGQRASDVSYGMNGAFEIPYDKKYLVVLASNGMHWDHVSVHTLCRHEIVCDVGISTTATESERTPTWDEMDYIRKLFFRGDEWVIQYHAPVDKHIEDHPHVLHMWRPQRESVPVPPRAMV